MITELNHNDKLTYTPAKTTKTTAVERLVQKAGLLALTTDGTKAAAKITDPPVNTKSCQSIPCIVP